MAPRTLTRRYREQGSSWVYPAYLKRRLTALQDSLDALAASGGVDPEGLAQATAELAALRAEVGQANTTAAAVEAAQTAIRDDLHARLDAEAADRAAADDAALARANAAMKVANTGRDTAAAATARIDELPATVEAMIQQAAGAALAGAMGEADQAHAALHEAVDALAAQVATLPTDQRAAALERTVTDLAGRVEAEEQARAALANAVVSRLSVLDDTITNLTTRTASVESGQSALGTRVDGLVARADTATTRLDGLTTRAATIEQVATALTARVDALTTRVTAAETATTTLTARLAAEETARAALAARVDALTNRRTYEANAAALLPALAIGTPKDVDVPWEATLPTVPHSVWVAGIDGISVLPTWTVKSVTATKVVVTVTSPALLALNVARIRVGGLYERTT